jgi:excinuclease ABC subunit A
LKGAGVPLNRIVFSEKFACPVSGFTIDRSSRACFRSTRRRVPARPAMVWARSCCSIRNWSCPMSAVDQGGAVVPWAKSNPPSPYYMQVLASWPSITVSLETQWHDLPAEAKIVILYGTGKTPCR